MGKAQQRKGRRGELELALLLREYGYPAEAGRAVSYGAEPDVTGLPGIHIECKRGKQQRLYEWLEQARRDAERFQDGLPAVFWRQDRRPWLVCMEIGDFLSARKPQKPMNGGEVK